MKQKVTIQTIIENPLIITSEHLLKNHEKIVLRPILKTDVGSFGKFLEGLKEQTRSKFGPHPLTMEEARSICNNINYSETLRILAINANQEIIGYMILSFVLRDSQIMRYQNYNIALVNHKDACIAPVVRDDYQNKGVGSILLNETIKLSRSLGIRYLILWQGVQATNERAVHYYEKFGFEKNGEFDRYGTHNVDMTLKLSENKK